MTGLLNLCQIPTGTASKKISRRPPFGLFQKRGKKAEQLLGEEAQGLDRLHNRSKGSSSRARCEAELFRV
eukprot:5527001-Pyramimonas_sp.AAC.1